MVSKRGCSIASSQLVIAILSSLILSTIAAPLCVVVPGTTQSCPQGWSFGTILWDCVDSANSIVSSSNVGNVSSDGDDRIYQNYCCNSNASSSINFTGNVCLPRYGGSCPSGWSTTGTEYMWWGSSRAGTTLGNYPDTTFNSANTRVDFCCKTSSGTLLPSNSPICFPSPSVSCPTGFGNGGIIIYTANYDTQTAKFGSTPRAIIQNSNPYNVNSTFCCGTVPACPACVHGICSWGVCECTDGYKGPLCDQTLTSGSISTGALTSGEPVTSGYITTESIYGRQASSSGLLPVNLLGILLPISLTLLLVAVVSIVIALVYYRRRAKKDAEMAELDMKTLKPPTLHRSDSSGSITMAKFSRNASSSSLSDQWEIDFSDLEIQEELGHGAYGVVFKCRWRNAIVAVKQMKLEKQDHSTINAFLKEVANMKRMRPHPNVVQLLGVCTNMSNPLCIVTEYLQLGSLYGLLHNMSIKIDLKMMIEMAKDIVRGMIHLYSENILHRDLAARNLLVDRKDDKYVIKVSDFGMASQTDTGIYSSTDNRTFPVKWSALEVMAHGVYTKKTDIWSFGVVLWEIMERKIPYMGMSNSEVVEKVQRGYRLPRPELCPVPLYNQVMHACWEQDPLKRPDFEGIYVILCDYVADDNGEEDNLKKPAKKLLEVPGRGSVEVSEYQVKNEQFYTEGKSEKDEFYSS